MKLGFTFFVLFFANVVLAQNIGIGTNTPHASAALEIQDSSKGILIPRLTMAQRNAIQNPADGLMVYQTDSTKGFWYYREGVWDNISSSQTIKTLIYSQNKGVKLAIDQSQLWTCPNNVYYITIELWGAGGGGAGGKDCGGYNFRGGAGGNGGYIKSFVNVVPGTSYQIIIGNGGIGGKTTPCCGIFQEGADGGNSSFDGVIAYGGKGGKNPCPDINVNINGENAPIINYTYNSHSSRTYIPSSLFATPNSFATGGSGGFNYSMTNGANGENGFCIISY